MRYEIIFFRMSKNRNQFWNYSMVSMAISEMTNNIVEETCLHTFYESKFHLIFQRFHFSHFFSSLIRCFDFASVTMDIFQFIQYEIKLNSIVFANSSIDTLYILFGFAIFLPFLFINKCVRCVCDDWFTSAVNL